jgi:hypothetical protein
MMAFFYRNANATLDAVATNEGNEVIEEITGMSSSLESYSTVYTSAEASCLVLWCQNIGKTAKILEIGLSRKSAN